MNEMQPLLMIGSLSITPYSLLMALGALLALTFTLLNKRSRLDQDTLLTQFLISVPAAMIFGHLVWCIPNIGRTEPYAEGFSILWKFWVGGYTLYGAIIGVLIATVLYARKKKVSAGALLDAIVPGACLMLIFGRAAEYFNGQGIGMYVEEDIWKFFPISVCTYAADDYQEWRLAVFAWECLAAVILLAVTLTVSRRPMRDGSLAEMFIVLLGATQIILEQARRDDCVAFHNDFIRLTQLLAAILMAGVLVLRILRDKRSAWLWQRVALFALTITIVILVEFSFEKPRFWIWLRLCLVLEGALAAVSLAGMRTHRGRPLIQAIAVPLVCAALIVLSYTIPDWEVSLVTWAMMAEALAVMAQACLCQKDGSRA